MNVCTEDTKKAAEAVYYRLMEGLHVYINNL